MKRRTVIALAAVAIATAVTLAGMASGEPEYKGKELSEWLRIYSKNHNADLLDDIDGKKAKLEARDAVLQIGTKAVPWLTKWIGFENRGQIRAQLIAIRWAPASRVLARVCRYMDKIGQKSCDAPYGFEILGERASAAVPDLARFLGSTDPTNQYPMPRLPRPAVALGWIGKEGLPPLVKEVADPKSTRRVLIVGFLGQISERLGTNAALLVPMLTNGVQDSDTQFAVQCAVALRTLKVDPETVAPALAKALTRSDRALVMNSISALKEKGRKAEAAVPALLDLYKGPDGNIRDAAEAAVRIIAPERLERRE